MRWTTVHTLRSRSARIHRSRLRTGMDPTQPTLTLRPDSERFELRADDDLAFAAYTLVGRTLFLAYTEVPDALRERGWEQALLRGVYDYARVQKLRVIPICPLARAFLEQEPQYRDLVPEDAR